MDARPAAVRGGEPVAARYLRYNAPHGKMAGLDHWVRNLGAVVTEAFATGRQAVLPRLRLHPKHNFGVERDWRWDTYVDLAAGRIVDSRGGVAPLPLCGALPARTLRTLHLPAGEAMPREAEGVELVVRETSIAYRTAVPDEVRKAGLAVDIPPSARVAELAAGVVAALEPAGYAAVHVRRGDTLRPEYEQALSPAGIRRRLAELGVCDGARVFFMSNEHDQAFWDELGAHYEAVRYPDFPFLAELVAPAARTERDNYLLYAAERLVMARGRPRVETLPSTPRAANRTLLGWAEAKDAKGRRRRRAKREQKPQDSSPGTGGGRLRYLRYDPPARPGGGLQHWRANLRTLATEAFLTGRIAVLPTLRLDPKHNFGVDRDWCWGTYFDLAAGRLVDPDGGVHALPVCAAVPDGDLRTVRVAAEAPIPEDAIDADLVVRESPSLFRRAFLGTHPTGRVDVTVPPSDRVRHLAAPVIAKLVRRGGYVAVHVRRGDRLRPELEEALSPAGVRRRLRELGVHDGERVLFLSDERDPAFWAELGEHYETVRSAHFPELAALASPAAGSDRDNYLLYAVERVVMASAWRRVGTYRAYRGLFGHVDASLLDRPARAEPAARTSGQR